MTIWRTRITTCWIPKATNTQWEYVILLFHCNNDCTKRLKLRYTYNARLFRPDLALRLNKIAHPWPCSIITTNYCIHL